MDKAGENSLVGEMLAAVALVIAIMVFGTGFAVGHDKGKHTAQVEAVQHGLGEWVSDKNGSTTFRWKVEQPKTVPSTSAGAVGFHNPATAEDYEHMHDYLQKKDVK
jgi:hypothetical protein